MVLAIRVHFWLSIDFCVRALSYPGSEWESNNAPVLVERSKSDMGENRVQQPREQPSPIDGDRSDRESDRAGHIWM